MSHEQPRPRCQNCPQNCGLRSERTLTDLGIPFRQESKGRRKHCAGKEGAGVYALRSIKETISSTNRKQDAATHTCRGGPQGHYTGKDKPKPSENITRARQIDYLEVRRLVLSLSSKSALLSASAGTLLRRTTRFWSLSTVSQAPRRFPFTSLTP